MASDPTAAAGAQGERGSFRAADADAGSIVPMFSFGKTPPNGTLFINPSTGEPMSKP